MCFGPAILLVALTTVAQDVRYNRDVRPILANRCFRCHGPDAGARKAELRLDRREIALRVIRPHRADSSELIRRVTSRDPDERMPPFGTKIPPLTAGEIAVLRRWIDGGAEYEPHWAYLPLTRPSVPAVSDRAWPANPIDRFVLARLDAAGIAPSPETDPVTLLRRVFFDLTGLPPSPADVDAYLEAGGDRYQRLVERLLRSPRHAERLAMHWLDLVRFADTVGYHGDQVHHITPYRDYVLRAFRDDLPFDQFTIEQLAGDLLPNPTEEQRIATGYNRVLQTSHEGGVQPGEYLAKYAADRVRNLGSVWLGSTVACAECHDHKYDPLTQREFYRFKAFFADIQEKGDFKGAPDRSPTKRLPELDVTSQLDREFLADLRRELVGLRENGAEAAEIRALEARITTLEQTTRRTMVTVATAPRIVRVLPRGNWLDDSGEVVEPGVPSFLPALEVEGRATRLDLAKWLTRGDNPLTPRAFVNRLWQLFFGVGLSRVVDDLGTQGQWPTHPELLDWLAAEFVEAGWSVRHVIRLIVTSSTYRQASLPRPELADRDATNRLFARQSRFRVQAEMVRDAVLQISGLLVHRFGGDSVRPAQPAGYYANLNFPKREYRPDRGPERHRRGVYVHWQRQFVHPMLKAFDAPSREECTAERPISNTPAAALAMLNDPVAYEAARAFATRLCSGAGADRDRLRRAWREAVSREPTARELAILADLLARHRRDQDQQAAWVSVARVILNLSETITRY